MNKRHRILFAGLLATVFIAVPALAETGSSTTQNIDLTPLFQALLALLASLITAKLIPWVKAHTNVQQQQALTSAVRTLVYAAEQLYKSQSGEFKLRYVQEQLSLRGFTVDRDAIEAAVREMNWNASASGTLTEAAQADEDAPEIDQ